MLRPVRPANTLAAKIFMLDTPVRRRCVGMPATLQSRRASMARILNLTKILAFAPLAFAVDCTLAQFVPPQSFSGCTTLWRTTHARQTGMGKTTRSPACECKPCSHCDGTGSVYFDLNGQYAGRHRFDDLCEEEPCDMCKGGIAEMCERCQQLDVWDADQEQASHYAEVGR